MERFVMEFITGFIIGALVGAAFLPIIWPRIVKALNRKPGA